MQRVVILGGYGLIGSACCRAFLAKGYVVTAIGRSPEAARFSHPALDWKFCDIGKTSAEEWRKILTGADILVNASGALQDGARDTLSNIHDQAIGNLIEASQDLPLRFIQISAAGVSDTAPSAFLRTKASGDARLIASTLDWVILRPTLVISANAYGGTALLRAAAGFPAIFPRVFPDSPIQTIWIEDLSNAVLTAASNQIPSGTIADLTESDAGSFEQTITLFRGWLGFKPWRFGFNVPQFLITTLGRVADGLGWLGWRSPLRTNALQTLKTGVTGNPDTWLKAGGAPCRSLEETLNQLPSSVQERWFARLFLLLPLAIATLAIFWTLSGLIALVKFDAAKEVLTSHQVPNGLASAIVLGGSFIDILLGLAIMIRFTAQKACFGMTALAGSYLVGSLFIAPDLWLDPIGPMVKVLPSIPLALIVAALLDER